MTHFIVTRRGLLGAGTVATADLLFMKGSYSSESDVRSAIVDTARSYLKSDKWAPDDRWGVLPTAYYCNIFVADVIREAGGASWDKIPAGVGAFKSRDPVSKEWADPIFAIKGWSIIFRGPSDTSDLTGEQILATRKPGDVVSNGTHMGIVSDNHTSNSGLTISASSNTGRVEEKPWSFVLPDVAKFNSAEEWKKESRKTASAFTVRRFG